VYSKKKYGQICAKETFRQSINRIWNISIAAALDISASDHSDVRAFKEELVRLLDATIKKVA
jgi:hypothetical protein